MKYSRARAALGAALSVAVLALAPELTSVAAQEPKAAPTPSEKSGLPLKAERKIAFDTDEGPWVSLDVSPDGKTLVFEVAGELYTLPIAGGKASNG